MRTFFRVFGLLSLAGGAGLGLVAACSATSDNVFGSGGAGGSGGAATTSSGMNTGGDIGFGGAGQGTGTGTMNCNAAPDADEDGDGFSINQGDCNDCDANVNPNAVEVDDSAGGSGGGAYVPADEDCDGLVDEPQDICDQGLAVDGTDPMDAARAIELCKQSSGAPNDWGVISAAWVVPDGSPPPAGQLANFDRGHGFVSGWGPNVATRAGDRMLAVSSGTGRQPTDVGYSSPGGFSKGYQVNHPQGFPKESPSCGVAVTGGGFDGTAVELQIQVPSNAQGFAFNLDFYTYEWPVYVCSTFNDFFSAILSPIPMGQTDGSISFDNQGNPVSVNNAYMDVCGCSGGPPCTAGGKTFLCPLGTNELTGTGFEGHAATSWLKTTAPVQPGQVISLRFAAWDSGDGVLDSTALIDNFTWIATPGTTVGTNPDPPQ